MVRIEFVEWGLANRFKDRIEVSKDLLKYPELLKVVLRHEMGHHPQYSFYQDLKHELKEKVRADLLLFIVTHPKTWVNYLPIWFYKGSLVIERTISLVWLIAIVWGLLLFSFMRLIK